MKPDFILCATLLLTACANHLPMPSTLSSLNSQHTWFQLEQRDAEGNVVQNSLLAVEQGADGVRFVQTDALGAPIARQVLRPTGWQNDGFVMPNAASRRLFAAILPLLANHQVYPTLTLHPTEQGQCYRQQGQEMWCSQTIEQGWLITFPEQTQWRLLPISESP